MIYNGKKRGHNGPGKTTQAKQTTGNRREMGNFNGRNEGGGGGVFNQKLYNMGRWDKISFQSFLGSSIFFDQCSIATNGLLHLKSCMSWLKD